MGATVEAGAGVAATNPLSRPALLGRLRERRTWDLVVIGGGATGLGCAVDAAARGDAVLLLEARDIGQGTSSRSTKLIHGGVRYLGQGNLALVREALAERARLLANAPHLVRPQRFVIPAYRRLERAFFGLGLAAYDALAGRHGLGRCRLLDAAETLSAVPTLEPSGLRGGVAYWDAAFDDARLAVALARTALALGAVVVNYAPVVELVREGARVAGVVATDAETGEAFHLSARAVINATGVWADTVRRLERPAAEGLLRPSQGIHLVVDRAFLPGDDALLVPRTADGRVLFLIPWQGKVLIGTTDTARADCPVEPRPLDGEVDFVLGTAARYLARPPRREDVRSVFAGLRPLIGAGHRGATRSLSREHCIERSAGGLVTVTGGKWTTYRRMAEEAVDAARAVARLTPRRSRTSSLALYGAGGEAGDPYGRERAAIDALPGRGRRLIEGLTLTEAEVRHAARSELARRVEDVLARRHRALFLDAALAAEAAPAVAALLAEELGHGHEWCEAEVRAFRTLAEQYRLG